MLPPSRRCLKDAKPAPVLEIFLTISRWAERPDGLKRAGGSDGKRYWSVSNLRHQKHCIKLGKRGVLEGEGSCSKRVLIGRWPPERIVAAGTRKVSDIMGENGKSYGTHGRRLGG